MLIYHFVRFFLMITLLIHTGITWNSIRIHGLLSPFPPFDTWQSLQLFSDLSVSSALVLLLLISALQAQGRKVRWIGLGLLFGVAFTGSFALLVFLIIDSQFLPNLVRSLLTQNKT